MSAQNTLTTFIMILSTVLWVAIVIRALMSWFMPQDGGGGVGRVLHDITEPVLGPVRRVLPALGGLDLSPIVAIILINVVENFLVQLLRATA